MIKGASFHGSALQGTGSLQSFHANNYAFKGDTSKPYYLHNPAVGSLGLFPRLDVMAGDSSAYNDGEYQSEWRKYPLNKWNTVGNDILEHELIYGCLNGYRAGSGGGDNPWADTDRGPPLRSTYNQEPQDPICNDTVDHAIAEAPHGWHAVDDETLALQKQLNFTHNKGHEMYETIKGFGLGRLRNPAVGPANAQNLPTSVDPTVPLGDSLLTGPDGTEVTAPEVLAAHGVVA